MGVFQIRNTTNDKIYIGSSLNLDAIWNRERFQLNMGSHRNQSLQKDWSAMSEESFVFEILEELKENEKRNLNYSVEVKTAEQLYIQDLQPFGEKGYNRKSG